MILLLNWFSFVSSSVALSFWALRGGGKLTQLFRRSSHGLLPNSGDRAWSSGYHGDCAEPFNALPRPRNYSHLVNPTFSRHLLDGASAHPAEQGTAILVRSHDDRTPIDEVESKWPSLLLRAVRY